MAKRKLARRFDIGLNGCRPLPVVVWKDLLYAPYHAFGIDNIFGSVVDCQRQNKIIMTTIQQIVTIATIVVATQLTRWLPFWIFKSSQQTPAYIHYLGNVLPPAIFAMLVIYCYKDTDFLSPAHGLPQLVSGLCVAGMQLLFKNMCLSILAGTGMYIVWIN